MTPERRLHWLTRCVLLLATLPALSLASANHCTVLSNRIDDSENQLDELVKRREEMNREFKEHVSEDLTAQAEGVLDELHRNAAIKISFARRKLGRAIDEKTSTVGSMKKGYCSDCESAAKNIFAKVSFCTKCPDRSSCQDEAKPEE